MNSDFCVAVHALVYLNRRGCVLSSEELARNICTNPARVRKVLARMKKDGLVETKEGSSGGGYRFAKGAGRCPWPRWPGAGGALRLHLLAQRQPGGEVSGGHRHGSGDGCPF